MFPSHQKYAGPSATVEGSRRKDLAKCSQQNKWRIVSVTQEFWWYKLPQWGLGPGYLKFSTADEIQNSNNCLHPQPPLMQPPKWHLFIPRAFWGPIPSRLHAHTRNHLSPPSLTLTTSSTIRSGEGLGSLKQSLRQGLGFMIYWGCAWKKNAVRRWGKQGGEQQGSRVEVGRLLRRCTLVGKEFVHHLLQAAWRGL